MLKKRFRFLIVVLSVFLLSIPVLAAVSFGTVDPATGRYFVNHIEVSGNNDANISTLKTSQLSNSGKAFMREWLSSPESGRALFCDISGQYLFFVVSDTLDLSDMAGRGSVGFLKDKNPFRVLKYNCYSGDYVPSTANPESSYVSGSAPYNNIYSGSTSFYLLIGSSIAQTIVDSGVADKVSLDYFQFYNSISITDDDGLLDDDTPSPTPRPTNRPPYVPPDPVVPPGNSEYVPYNTGIWQTFFKFVSKNIGSIVNIGFLIFAIVFGWYLIPKVVRHFTRVKRK